MIKYRPGLTEWPTLLIAVATYALWAIGVFVLPQVSLALAIVVTGWAATQHSSLSHEALHGHPFRNPFWNATLVFPALSLCIPYGRFRDTHLAHHNDSRLTDPYDDPESNFMDPAVWDRTPAWIKVLLRFNNTLAGRLVIGPLVGHVFWLRGDVALIRAGDRAVIRAWVLHLPAMALVIWWVSLSPMPFWAYLCATYLSLSLLKIRTFLEHRAHEHSAARTVVIESQGPLALLFLNNSLHMVHHMHPGVAWYDLPGLYRANPDRYLGRNEGYVYRSYIDVFRAHFFRAKDPVPHPLWRRD